MSGPTYGVHGSVAENWPARYKLRAISANNDAENGQGSRYEGSPAKIGEVGGGIDGWMGCFNPSRLFVTNTAAASNEATSASIFFFSFLFQAPFLG